jgi:LruC domain-containing protein
MKTKKVNFLVATLLLSVVTSLTFTGCEQDYYDPSRQKGSGTPLFGDSIIVPEGFDWDMTRSVDVHIKVDDKYNSAFYYIVEIFNANPLFDKDAVLLSMGVANSNSDYISKVVIPDAVNTIYIQQTSPTGGKTIAPVEVISNINYTFGTTVVPANSVLRSAIATVNESNSYEIASRATSAEYPIPSLPEDVTVINQTSGIIDSSIPGNAYLISSNFSGKINLWKKTDLFIQGNVNLNEELSLTKDSRLIMMPGASLSTNNINLGEGSIEMFIQGALTVDRDFVINENSKLLIYDGGSVIFNNSVYINKNSLLNNNGIVQITKKLQASNENATIVNNKNMTINEVEITQNTGLLTNNGTLNVSNEIKISNNGKILNNNTVNSNNLTLDNGTFENEGVTTITGTTSSTNNTCLIRNNNMFTTYSLKMQGNAKLINNCHFVVMNLMDITDASVSIGQDGLLTTANLHINNTLIELGSAAMMKITNIATYKYNTSSYGFHGVGAKKALLQIAKAVKHNDAYANIIHYAGNLEIECYDHPAKMIDPYNQRWTENGVTWAGEGGSTLVIAPTECNDGGYSNAPIVQPSNPVFPIIWYGSDVTYLFEDNWPFLGDYDMNDVVLYMKPEYTLNEGNKVTQLKLNFSLRAVGGVKRLAVGVQLDEIAANLISSVARTNNTGRDNSVFTSNPNGLEGGHVNAVIPIFDDIHKAIGVPPGTIVNTLDGNQISPVTVSFTISFSSPVDVNLVSIQRINPFIVNGGYKAKRDEVHLPGFTPTVKANTGRFGVGDDNSTSAYYTSKGNLIWGLAIPSNFHYPKEFVSIRQAYPNMESWAKNAGTTSKDWYLHPQPSLIINQQ